MKTRSNKFVVSMMLVLTMVFTTISPLFTVQAAAPIPTALSSNVHPRVLFTAEDIDSIKAVVEDNIAERETSEYSSARAYFKRRADVRAEDATDNGDPDNHNDGWNEKKLAGIEAKALAYVLREDVYNTSIKKSGRNTGYEELGARAVQYLKKYLETVDMSDVTDSTTRSRNSGEILRVVAEVYDWCYDLFDRPIQKVAVTVGEETPAEGQTVTVTKAEIRSLVNTKLLSHFEMGSTFRNQGGMVGHGAEAQLLRDGLSWAIAVYGEDQSVWNNVATRFYNEYVPIRNHFLPSAWNLQGTEYGFYRNQWDAWSYLLITGMGAESPYSVDAIEGLGDTALGITYSRRPDGQFFRDGDVPIASNEYFSRWTKYNTAFLDAAVAQNPYVYGEYVETKPSGQGFYEDTAVPILVMAGRSGAALAKTTPKATKNLPLTKFFGGTANIMFARTGWSEGPDSNVAAAMMKIGGEFIDNHQHYDAGTFQLYYKGILATESGIYQGATKSDYSSDHRAKYAIRTIAHNGILIGGSGQKEQYNVSLGVEPDNLGEQKTVATLTSYSVDQTNPENPSYSYVKGNLSKAYGSDSLNYKRSYMFLNFKNDDVPAAMVVYDYVGSTDSKTWLVHGVNAPAITVANKQAVFTNTRSDASGSYNGKMTVDTLLPESATYSTVTGFKSGSSTYDATPASPVDEGKGTRLEVKAGSSDHQLLNVMQVSDADKSNYLPVTKISGNGVVGVQIADKVVTFNANGATTSSQFSFTAPAGNFEYIITDVQRGAWQVSTDANFTSATWYGTSDDNNANVLHFEKDLSSSQTLYFRYNANGGFTGSGISSVDRTMGESTSYDFYAMSCTEKDGTAVATKNDALVDENGMPLVAVEDLANAMDAAVSVEGDTVTFTKDGKTAQFTIGSATIVEDGNSFDKPNQAAPVMFRDEMYVSPVTVAPYFRARFVLDRENKTIIMVANEADGELAIEYSTDGVNYTPVKNFAFGTREYNVELPYQTNVAYVRVVNSLGGQYFSTTNTIANETQPINATWSSATAFVQAEYGFERFLSNKDTITDDTTVTIKNGAGTMKMYYMGPGEEGFDDVFTVNFTAEQPSITLLSNDMPIAANKDVNSYPVYVSGAAAWNDNGTIIDSSILSPHQEGTSSTGYKYNCNIWALGNISPSLQGASQLILPLGELSGSSVVNGKSGYRNTLVSFKATAPGRVVVLMANEAGAGSGYLTDYAWHKGANNGIGINGIKTGSNLVTKTTLAPSSDAQYHAIAYKWKTAQFDETDKDITDQGKPTLRTSFPGVIDSPNTNDSISDSQKLLYSYYSDFDEDEKVTIYNPKNWKQTGGGLQECRKESLMTVFVIYDEDKMPPLSGEGLQIKYAGKDGKYSALNTNNMTEDEAVEVTLPKNSTYAYVQLDAVDKDMIPEYVTYTWNPEGVGVDGERLIGTNKDDGSRQRIGGISLVQTLVPVKALKMADGTFKIPIKNENSVMSLTYNDKVYKVSFKARQPRLTYMGENGTNRIGDDESTKGTDHCVSTVMFVGGAAANNDNGSIMKTNLPSTTYDDWWQVRTLSNICENLEGASMFMLPRLKAKSSGVQYFRFEADTPGTIYVITDIGCQSGTIETTNAMGNPWGKASGDNTFSDTSFFFNHDRTFNDYGKNLEAFAYSVSWIASSNSNKYTSEMDDSAYPHGMNHYRTLDPGVYGTITDDVVGSPDNVPGYDYTTPYIRQVKAMNRAYKCRFDAGETMYVYAFGNSDQSAIFVKWDEVPDEEEPAGPLTMKFSSNDTNYVDMKFDADKTEYNVNLADNAKYGYVSFEVPDPKVIPEDLFTSFDAEAYGVDGETLIGTVGEGRTIGTQSRVQLDVPMEAQRSTSGGYVVPIKNEHGTLKFTYAGTEYTINFTAKQPRLTELTSYISDSSAEVIYVGGGAVNNDNGSIIESSRDVEDKTTTDSLSAVKVKALSNVSNKLLGSSLFMLPAMNREDETLFTFTADHDGTVVVMSDTEINAGAYADWTCNNNGTHDAITIQSGTVSIQSGANGYRNRNNYANSPEFDYYAYSIGWWTAVGTASITDGGFNKVRSYNPGVTGNLTNNGKVRSSAHYNNAYALTYAYSLSFKAGEQVTIPGMGVTSSDSAVFIIWDAPTSGIGYELSDFDGYSPAIDENGNINIDATQLTQDEEHDEQVLVATYDENGCMTDLVSATGVKSIHVGSEYDYDSSRIIGIYVNDLKTFKPIFTLKQQVRE